MHRKKERFSYILRVSLNFYVSHGKQAIGNSAVTVGYIMKPSREEDFAKVSCLYNRRRSVVVAKKIFKKRK